jgi:type I restriction enzyme S subunit
VKWPFLTIGEIATKVGSGATPRGGEKVYRSSGIPFIRSMNVHFCGFSAEGLAHINDAAATALDGVTVRAGDVLLNITGASIGRVTTAPKHVDGGRVSQHVCIIRPNSAVDSSFLAHWFAAPRSQRQILEQQSGVTRQALTKQKILEFEVPVPPLAEQCRIVEALETHFTRIDAAVAALKRAREGLRLFRAAVLQAAMEGRLGDDVDPARWEWVTMDDLLNGIEAGRSFRCVERPPEGDEVGVVKVSAVTWGEFDSDESKTCEDVDLVRPEFFIAPDDFLFSRANTIELVGACVIARNVRCKLMLSDKILRFRLRFGTERWVLLALRSRHGRKEIERLATGNQESMRNIGQQRIRQIRLPLPKADERDRIVATVDSYLDFANQEEATVELAHRRIEHLRQSLLHLAFDGRLVSEDPREEPASVLLERLRRERAAGELSAKKKISRSRR